MISILITLLVFVIVIGLVFYVLSILPLPAPWKTIVTVIVCLIAILILLSMLGVWGPGPLVIRR